MARDSLPHDCGAIRPCDTANCSEIATRVAEIFDGESDKPVVAYYCDECGDSLRRGGENVRELPRSGSERQHIGYSEAVRVKRGGTWLLSYEELEVTDEMVERGARVLAAQFDHAYSDAVEPYTRDYWNHLARNMLLAALLGSNV